jgi:hypothetical protein
LPPGDSPFAVKIYYYYYNYYYYYYYYIEKENVYGITPFGHRRSGGVAPVISFLMSALNVCERSASLSVALS